ncbi:MAG TPA: hypothetical protein VFI03_02525 [Solirubrobacterales bacterium]|nr:hypothetical protein [Solirubrobacterales bacterium]
MPKSLWKFVKALGRHYLWLVFTVLLGVVGLVELVFGVDLKLPFWAFWVIGGVLFAIAAYLAYDEVSEQLEAAESEATEAPREKAEDGLDGIIAAGEELAKLEDELSTAQAEEWWGGALRFVQGEFGLAEKQSIAEAVPKGTPAEEVRSRCNLLRGTAKRLGARSPA